MFNRLFAAWNNSQKWYWEHGGEERIDPTGPICCPQREPWGHSQLGRHPALLSAAAVEIIRTLQSMEFGRSTHSAPSPVTSPSAPYAS